MKKVYTTPLAAGFSFFHLSQLQGTDRSRGQLRRPKFTDPQNPDSQILDVGSISPPPQLAPRGGARCRGLSQVRAAVSV